MKNWQQVTLQSNWAIKKQDVFPTKQKNLKKAVDIYFGLIPKKVRHLAYDYGKALNKKMPKSWVANLMAVPDWYLGFLTRHSRHLICTPQATNLSKATNINKTNVDLFFQNVSIIMERHHFLSNDIYNMDETSITTVQRPDRIVAGK
ncbi:hypothetical protein ILUMI_02009 [Ignelater luminosus]|uniref:Uncharacterized protein n=1 Tax=Ignelater luminosus TaxID=2038154 RepID=A0A8K0DPL0_IGNLU|nr:hypothetical protein ILUMI_02009 [Ignelater luminosus]